MDNLALDGILSGTLNLQVAVTGNLEQLPNISGTVVAYTGVPEYPIFPGPYEVDARTDANVVLETAHKLMTEDVTVQQIAYTETVNQAGGITVTIG